MLAAFIADRMSAYIAGEMNPETAAQYTREELAAIYQGDHYSRDTSGAMRVTPPPEALDIETALKKTNAAIAEILKCCTREAISENPAPMEALTKIEPPSGSGKKSGLEGFEEIAEYARRPA